MVCIHIGKERESARVYLYIYTGVDMHIHIYICVCASIKMTCIYIDMYLYLSKHPKINMCKNIKEFDNSWPSTETSGRICEDQD
jgi:hypothetical protein